MNYYQTSTGERVSQSQINSKLSNAKKGWLVKYICECCHKNQTNDPDHTISQKRCKELHKAELIWTEGNISWSCRTCHQSWESYKSGLFSNHYNAYNRMLFVAMHDPETFKKRFQCITNKELKQRLEELYDNIDEES